MPFLFTFILLAVIGFMAWRVAARRFGPQVHDAEGHRIPTRGAADGARVLATVVAPLLILIVLATSFRVVPVGHALVIFNTLTRSFRLARQGITFVPPFISATADYDLRRLEYTMSGVAGEGRRMQINDSLWSPTKEGLQVGIDLTV